MTTPERTSTGTNSNPYVTPRRMVYSCSRKSSQVDRVHAECSLQTTMSYRCPLPIPACPYIGSEEQEHPEDLDHCRGGLRRGGLASASSATDARQLSKECGTVSCNACEQPWTTECENRAARTCHNSNGGPSSSARRQKTRTAMLTLPPYCRRRASSPSNGCREHKSL